jgi:hypothetical protein
MVKCHFIDITEYKRDDITRDIIIADNLLTKSLLQFNFTWNIDPQVYTQNESSYDPKSQFQLNGNRYDYEYDSILIRVRIELPSTVVQGNVFDQDSSNFDFEVILSDPLPGPGSYRLDSGYPFTCTVTEWNTSTNRATLNFSGQLEQGGDYITISSGVLTARISN